MMLDLGASRERGHRRQPVDFLSLALSLFSAMSPFLAPCGQGVAAIVSLIAPVALFAPPLMEGGLSVKQPFPLAPRAVVLPNDEALHWIPPPAADAYQQFSAVASEFSPELLAHVRQLETANRRLEGDVARLAGQASQLRSALRNEQGRTSEQRNLAAAWEAEAARISGERNDAWNSVRELELRVHALEDHSLLGRVLVEGESRDVRQRPAGRITVGHEVEIYVAPTPFLDSTSWSVRGCQHQRISAELGPFIRFVPTNVGTCRVHLRARRLMNSPPNEVGDFGVIVIRP